MDFELTTERLILKVLNSNSTELVLNFYNRNKGIFEQYEPQFSPNFYSFDFHDSMLNYEYQMATSNSMIRYWIFEKNNMDRIVGTVSIRNIINHLYSSCTVGYKIDKDLKRNGFCSEALNAIIPHVAESIDIHRFEAFVLPNNIPSMKLLEKVGFQNEGLLRDYIEINGERRDHYIYTYLADN